MAAPNRAKGFTLVELLVVITIIGMLVSLLLPAIQSAREAGRRNTCSSNMRNTQLALSQYEGSKKSFPGYVNIIAVQTTGGGTQYRRVSWVVPILPYLERNDLYQNWQSPNFTSAQINTALSNSINPAQPMQGQFISTLNVLVCPSNPNPNLGTNPLSFVVNTGRAYTGNDTNIDSAMSPIPSGGQFAPEDVNTGVFFNHSNWDGNLYTAGMPPGTFGSPKKTTVDFISTNDGTTYTLMLSENLQAFAWATDPVDATATTLFAYDFSVRQGTGFVWFLTGNPNNNGPPSIQVTGNNYNGNAIGINDSSKSVTGAAYAGSPTANMPPFMSAPLSIYSASGDAAGQPSGLSYARPSSNHPGGVNAAFVGGNMRYLNDEIDYKVYTQLCTPNQNSMNAAPLGATAFTPRTASQPWTYTLNEGDY